MPIIELILPGARRTETQPIAENYRITIERDDGIACTDIEAMTVMSLWSIENTNKRLVKSQKKQKKSAELPEEPCFLEGEADELPTFINVGRKS